MLPVFPGFSLPPSQPLLSHSHGLTGTRAIPEVGRGGGLRAASAAKPERWTISVLRSCRYPAMGGGWMSREEEEKVPIPSGSGMRGKKARTELHAWAHKQMQKQNSTVYLCAHAETHTSQRPFIPFPTAVSGEADVWPFHVKWLPETQAQAAQEWTEAAWAMQEPGAEGLLGLPGAMGLLPRGLQGSPVRTGLRKTGPEDKSWASGNRVWDSGLDLSTRRGGCLVAISSALQGRGASTGLLDGPSALRLTSCRLCSL